MWCMYVLCGSVCGVCTWIDVCSHVQTCTALCSCVQYAQLCVAMCTALCRPAQLAQPCNPPPSREHSSPQKLPLVSSIKNLTKKEAVNEGQALTKDVCDRRGSKVRAMPTFPSARAPLSWRVSRPPRHPHIPACGHCPACAPTVRTSGSCGKSPQSEWSNGRPRSLENIHMCTHHEEHVHTRCTCRNQDKT